MRGWIEFVNEGSKRFAGIGKMEVLSFRQKEKRFIDGASSSLRHVSVSK